jgi:hypothetical protein
MFRTVLRFRDAEHLLDNPVLQRKALHAVEKLVFEV